MVLTAQAGANETFTIEKVGGGSPRIIHMDRIALKTADGHYLRTYMGGLNPVDATGVDTIDPWTLWNYNVNPQ